MITKKVAAVMFVTALTVQVAPAFANDADKAVSTDKKATVDSKKGHKAHKAKLAMVGTESKAEEKAADGHITDAGSSEFYAGGGN